MNTDRAEREQAFYNDSYIQEKSRRKKAHKYYTASKAISNAYIATVSEHCKGKTLLEYGCGTGSGSELWIESGATVTGIDISPEGIKKAKERIPNADYFVMDAENTEFIEDSFDIVAGTGILHHLNLSNSYRELSRIVKADGHIVFTEPLGHNPLINLYRRLTPHIRTKDEHPLKTEDIELLGQYFRNIEITYFALFTLFSVPFRKVFFFDRLYRVLGEADEIAFRSPSVRKHAWTVLIHASHPHKE
jgi:SAM-dependent methyltransferase